MLGGINVTVTAPPSPPGTQGPAGRAGALSWSRARPNATLLHRLRTSLDQTEGGGLAAKVPWFHFSCVLSGERNFYPTLAEVGNEHYDEGPRAAPSSNRLMKSFALPLHHTRISRGGRFGSQYSSYP